MRRGDDDAGELADKLEHEADTLESRSEDLGDEVDRVRQDWRRKRADEGVPGAVPEGDAGAEPDDSIEESGEATETEGSGEQTRTEEPG